jgi:hypothetical protein
VSAVAREEAFAKSFQRVVVFTHEGAEARLFCSIDKNSHINVVASLVV